MELENKIERTPSENEKSILIKCCMHIVHQRICTRQSNHTASSRTASTRPDTRALGVVTPDLTTGHVATCDHTAHDTTTAHDRRKLSSQ